MSRWDIRIKLRNVVNAALETARNEKKIGKSLEAKVVLTVPVFETVFDDMSPEELADLLIVSQAELEKSAINEMKVDVSAAQGEKCERCWKVLPSVGGSAAHPTLCARCAAVVEKL